MIENTVAKLEQRIRALSALPEAKRAELIDLFQKLKAELAALPADNAEAAETITRFAELSAREATRSDGTPALQTLTREGLTASVDGFEASHPRLVQVVNSICTSLSNLGI